MTKTLSFLTRTAMMFTICLLGISAYAQTRAITGKVIDASGEPITGASVLVVGNERLYAVTDVDGTFSLNVPAGASLNVSFIGFATQVVAVGDRSQLEITLLEDIEVLDELVVVGYGTVKKTNFTGSVATYNVGDSPVSNSPKTNALELLRGLAPGVQMSQSGLAGATPNITIRGQKSISGGSDPLIVLDGVIFKGSINDIDPTTIENMSVMKDATSLASYGSQAANGVVMITSKKGLIGKPTINFRGTLSLVEQNYHPQLRNGEQYIELINARKGEPSGSTSWMSELELANHAAGEETDWVDYVSQIGVQQDYSLNVSGGTEGVNYLIGASYGDNTNFIKGNEFIRETITARVNSRINQYISAGLNFNWADTHDDGVRPGYTRYFSPYGEPEMPDGAYRKYLIGANQETATNPLWNVFNGVDATSRGNATTVGGNIEVKAPFLKGLSYRITGNYTVRDSENRRFTHETNLVQPTDVDYSTATTDKYLSQANGYIQNSKSRSWVLDNIITFDRTFGDHYVNATLVYTRDYAKSESTRFDGTDFSGIGNTTLGSYGLTNATTQVINSITYTLHTDVGYLARANYSFKNKYHFNASVRRDGSSVFGSENKWGTFPAAGVAWTASDEPFFKSLEAISYLKVKLSWGMNGNQSLAPYGTLSRMAMGRAGGIVGYFGGNPIFGESMTTLGNPNLGWETTTSWNGGWEAEFFKRMLHWEVDAYVSKTTDQIFNRTIPVMGAGITNQSATMGQVNNWGIESSLRATIVERQDFRWNATLNFTMNRNTLVELYGDGNDDITNNLFLGESLGAIYGYVYDGIVQTSDTDYMSANGSTPGDVKFVDLDGDGKVSASDRKILGFNKEAFRASLSTTLSWKNWSLYVMFNGVFSGGRYGKAENNNAITSSTEGMMYLNTVYHPFWTEENASTEYPRPWNVSGNLTYLQNYGFVRLQDVNLSYTFNRNWLKKVGMNSAELYVSGNNLFFIAPGWEYSDPEVRSFRSQQLRRTYTFGLNVKF